MHATVLVQEMVLLALNKHGAHLHLPLALHLLGTGLCFKVPRQSQFFLPRAFPAKTRSLMLNWNKQQQFRFPTYCGLLRFSGKGLGQN